MPAMLSNSTRTTEAEGSKLGKKTTKCARPAVTRSISGTRALFKFASLPCGRVISRAETARLLCVYAGLVVAARLFSFVLSQLGSFRILFFLLAHTLSIFFSNI